MASVPRLAPAAQLVQSGWPIFDIWHYNMTEGAAKPRAVAQPVLVTRPEFDPAPNALTPPQAAWIAAALRGASFAEAQDAATEADPDFDLTPLLSLLLQTGALTSLKTPKD